MHREGSKRPTPSACYLASDVDAAAFDSSSHSESSLTRNTISSVFSRNKPRPKTTASSTSKLHMLTKGWHRKRHAADLPFQDSDPDQDYTHDYSHFPGHDDSQPSKMVHHSLLARRNPNNAPLPGEPGPRHNKQPTSPWMDSDSDESSAFDRRESTRSRPHSFGRPESGSNTTSLQRHPSNAGRQMPPTLEQVLSDQAPPPYTRGAFTAYLSQNHCLESLEFYIDANKYEHDYNIVAKQLGTTVLDRRCPQTEHLCQLWQRLLTIYMYPGAAREINVAGDVRDDLLKYAHASIPPHPRTLSSAVNRIYELMEESIFIPFINSLPAPLPQPLGLPAGPRDDYYPYDRPNMTHLSLRRRFPAQPPSLAVSSSQSSTASPLGGDSLSNSPAPGSILSLTSLSSVQPMSTVNSELTSLHDSTYGNSDTLSMTSPADAEMMTPPTTPPIVEGQSQCPALSGLGALPPCPKQRENPWKKMGLRLGFKKKTSGTPISPKESAFEQQHAAATD